MITVHVVPIEYVVATWYIAEPFIVSGLREGGSEDPVNMTYTSDNVLEYLLAGEWELFIAVGEDGAMKGAATVSYLNYPLHCIAFITSVGGRLVVSQDSFNQIKQLFKQRGATIIQCYGRPGIIRLWKRFNFKPRSTLLEAII